MGYDKLGLVGIAIALLVVAIMVAQSNIEPAFVKGSFALGCIVGSILSIIALAKSI
jgi:hypothetical protein